MANGKHSKIPFGLSEADIKAIITENDAEKLVKAAEEIGRSLARQLTTSQIRAIFGEVRRIEGDWQNVPERASHSLILLKPKLAYRARKERGRGVEDLANVLTPAIDSVGTNHDNFTRFVEFFEAILAYHKANGGS